MKHSLSTLPLLVCLLAFGNSFGEQPANPSDAGAATPAAQAVGEPSPLQGVVPHLIKFGGRLRGLDRMPITGPVDVTFSLYSAEASETALWFEAQTVQADSLGDYTVLLGAMNPVGVPMELFTEGQARWLGVQVANLPEQPRVLLVSVPYALKAGDAETLGGKPASAFVLATQVSTETSKAAATGTLSGLVQANALTNGGGTTLPSLVMTANYIPVFTDALGNHGNSMLYQSGSYVGVGTLTPAFPFDVNNNVFGIGPQASSPGMGGTMRFRDDSGTVRWLFGIPGTVGSQDFFMYNLVNGHAPLYIENAAPSYSFYFKGNGNVGIGTAAPTQKLDVAGNVNISGSLKSASFAGNLKITGAGNAIIFPDGTVQSTAGTGSGGGTLTGVTAGTGLTGGGTAGNVTLTLASASCAAGQAAVGLPFTCQSFASPTALDTEAASRAAADTTLQSNLTAEVTARASADTTLQADVNSRVSKSGDTMTGNLSLTDLTATHVVTAAQGIINGSVSTDLLSVNQSGTGSAISAVSPATGAWPAGITILGHNTATSGVGRAVAGIADSTGGRGVVGLAQATTGFNVGVVGESDSLNGLGGWFYNTAGGSPLVAEGTDGSFEVDASGNVITTGSITAGSFASTLIISAGDLALSSGNISLPQTTSMSSGVINLGGNTFLHAYGTNNLFLGKGAGNFAMASQGNVAVGNGALYSNDGGNLNTAIGNQALSSNTSGYANAAVGNGALSANTTGTENTATGGGALSANTIGNHNTASGNSALYSSTTGVNNTAHGYQALYSNTVAGLNTAVGSKALYYSNGLSNTAIGSEAGVTSVTANANRSGFNNTFLGASSGPGVDGTSAPLTNATAVGANAVVSANNALVLGSINGLNGAGASVNVGIGTASPQHPLDVVGDINATGIVTAAGFSGNGAGLTGLTNADKVDGVHAANFATLGNNIFVGNQNVTGNLTLSGTITSNGLRAIPTANTLNVIAGDATNWVGSGVVGATIGGGGPRTDSGGTNVVPNRVTHHAGTVSGGANNQAGDDSGMPDEGACCATVGGGLANKAAGGGSTIGGGSNNLAAGPAWSAATIGGGDSNKASAWADTVAGGWSNTAQGGASFIGGGTKNTTSSYAATIGGGDNNTAGDYASTIGGGTGNATSGSWAAIPGGKDNTANLFSFAAGTRAKANDVGSFVWSDSTDADFTSAGFNTFAVRATGGAFFSNNLTAGGAVTAVSFSGDGSGLTNVGGSTTVVTGSTGTFGGTVRADGSLDLAPSTGTTSGAVGAINLGGNRFAHAYGSENTFVGGDAGNFGTTGTGNTATGFEALTRNSTGTQNTATGAGALSGNTAGGTNTAIGASALQANTDSSGNTAVGFYALGRNCLGFDEACPATINTALGYFAGVTVDGTSPNQEGAHNTFLGAWSGPGTTSAITNASAIGYQAVVSQSNSLVLGSINGLNGATDNVKVGIGTATPAYSLDVHGTANFTAGVSAASTGSGVAAVEASNSGNSSSGALATTANGNSAGVYGHNSFYGVYGDGTNSGVYGHSTSNYGVYGGSGNVGVFANGSNYGLYAMSNSGKAVYGTSSSGYAGFFEGNAKVTVNLEVGGALTVSGAKSFKIDHPTDPAHKVLYHAAVESPDMMNLYNGNAVLDSSGEAWVELPAYFQDLNQDFRYQLTPIGGPGPGLYIAQEIQNNRFKIAGGKAGLKVSWQVTGVRHDPYANAHRMKVEVEKNPPEQGRYLNPEVYGQPASKGVTWLESQPQLPGAAGQGQPIKRTAESTPEAGS